MYIYEIKKLMYIFYLMNHSGKWSWRGTAVVYLTATLRPGVRFPVGSVKTELHVLCKGY